MEGEGRKDWKNMNKREEIVDRRKSGEIERDGE